MVLTNRQDDRGAPYGGNPGKYLLVYFGIQVLAGLQFAIAYQQVNVTAALFRMFALAILEAGLMVVFFMRLGAENRPFVTWIAIVTLLVLTIMQSSWPDSYRMERDAPPNDRSPGYRTGPSQ